MLLTGAGSPAARMRALRRRTRLGLRLITVEIREHAMVDALIVRGMLSEDAALDRDQVARACGRIIRLWAEKV